MNSLSKSPVERLLRQLALSSIITLLVNFWALELKNDLLQFSVSRLAEGILAALIGGYAWKDQH